MPVVRRTEPMTEADRAAIRQVLAAPPSKPPSVLAGLVVSVMGCAVGLSPGLLGIHRPSNLVSIFFGIVFFGGLVAFVSGLVLAVSNFFRRRPWIAAVQRYRGSFETALTRGTVDVVEIVADAAWLAPVMIDPDAGALLLRVEPDRFVYINSQWEFELYCGEGIERMHRTITRRYLDAGLTALSMECGGEALSVREDLPQPPSQKVDLDRFSEAINIESDFSELVIEQLPDEWIPVVQRP